jgi:hypothetical protein
MTAYVDKSAGSLGLVRSLNAGGSKPVGHWAATRLTRDYEMKKGRRCEASDFEGLPAQQHCYAEA